MKAILVVILMALACSYASASDFLSKTEKKKILRAVDMICGDTWCEGDFNFSFKSLNCEDESRTCTLNYNYGFWPSDEMPAPEAFPYRSSCEIKKVSKYSDFLDYNDNLSDKVYEQITDCISLLK